MVRRTLRRGGLTGAVAAAKVLASGVATALVLTSSTVATAAPAPATPVWRVPVEPNGNGEHLTVASDGTLVYFTGIDGVTAVDARTGEQRWAYVGKRPEFGGYAPVAVGEGVVVTGRQHSFRASEVVVLDAATGAARWSTTMRTLYRAIPAAGMITFETAGASPTGGRSVWTYPAAGAAEPAWTHYDVIAGPLDGGLILAGSAALDQRTGQVLWSHPDLRRYYPLALSPDGSRAAGFGLYDNTARVMQTATGTIGWQLEFSDDLVAAADDGDQVYLLPADDDDQLTAVDAVSGAVRWRRPMQPGTFRTEGQVAARAGNLFIREHQRCYVREARSGADRFTPPLTGPCAGLVLAGDLAVYRDDQGLVAYRQSAQDRSR
ncbi:MAG TPA: PQQ-binding-like beta-propeller repeat protein [Pilimelia sp.]|nr:PQQ-binding-like beta-propeller repeat protein [Pilimelia sp.]